MPLDWLETVKDATEDTVLDWVKANEEKARIKALLETKLNDKIITETIYATGLPWA